MSADKPLTTAQKIASLGPVTRRRLEQLRRQLRGPPQIERHLTPDGMTEQVINALERESQSVEASYIDSRLRAFRGRAMRGFEKQREH